MARTPDFFRGKTLMVTGAASGLGRAAATTFAREGANIVCADIDTSGGTETVAMVERAGGQAIFVETDVVSRTSVEAAVAAAIDAFGGIDFQFNSAGAVFKRAPFLEIDDDLYTRTMDLNVKGVFHGMQAVLPHMLQRRAGVIVNVASMAHKRGGPGTSVIYAASKAAVLTMSLGVAREFADRGIRCLSISPGAVNTPFQSSEQTDPSMLASSLAGIPLGRICEPEEIGELVLFLCSDACPFMTADTVYVSGGSGWR